MSFHPHSLISHFIINLLLISIILIMSWIVDLEAQNLLIKVKDYFHYDEEN